MTSTAREDVTRVRDRLRDPASSNAWNREAADMLDALLAERDAARAEVAAARREGAEAMREAALDAVSAESEPVGYPPAAMAEKPLKVGVVAAVRATKRGIDSRIRALPLPGDKP